MFDDIQIEDWAEGIRDVGFYQFKSKAYPVPASEKLQIDFSNEEQFLFEVITYDYTGVEVNRVQNITSGSVSIDISDFTPGVYFYNLISKAEQKQSIRQFWVSYR
jgi:hypothetical protein